MILPVFVCAVGIVFSLFSLDKIGIVKLPQHQKSGYYTEMIIGGVKVADDQIEARAIKVDSAKDDDSSLYHLEDGAKIYYGPDSRYDVLAEGIKGQTVRVVGYMPNKKWFKIMIDNGETGYVNINNLQKGIGLPIPARSKVK